jgi:hypothetical protein
MVTGMLKPKCLEKNFPSATLSTPNPTFITESYVPP